TATAAVVGGVAGWLLLGPLGAVIGVVAGPLISTIVWVTLLVSAVPSASEHMASHEPYLALQEAGSTLWTWRKMARWWPGQFPGAAGPPAPEGGGGAARARQAIAGTCPCRRGGGDLPSPGRPQAAEVRGWAGLGPGPAVLAAGRGR